MPPIGPPIRKSNTKSLNSVTPIDSKLERSDTKNVVAAGLKGIQDEIDEAEAAKQKMQKDKLHMLVESNLFGTFIGVLILLNGVMLGVQTDYDFQTMGWVWQKFDTIQEYFFTICFVAELCLKGLVYKIKFFNGPDWAWNLFDSFLVGLSVLETFILPLLGRGGDLNQLSVLRMFRLVRLARLVRLLRVFRQLWLFVVGIVNAMKVMCWGVLLTVLVIYTFAIIVTRQFEPLSAEDPFFYAHFGTMPKSMFTLFQISTGDSWASGVVRPISEQYPNWELFFVFFLCITQFAFLNVVVAVIVESVLQQALTNDDEILKAAEAELRNVLRGLYDAFTEMDKDGDQELTRDEFLAGIEKPNVRVALSKVDISPEDAEEMFDILDHDKSGSLKLEEFIEGCVRGRGQAKAKDILWMMKRMSCVEIEMRTINSRFERIEKMLCPGSASDIGANQSANGSDGKLPASPAKVQPTPAVTKPVGSPSGAIEEALAVLTKSMNENFRDLSKRLEMLETDRPVPTATIQARIMAAESGVGHQQNITSMSGSKATAVTVQKRGPAEATPERQPMSIGATQVAFHGKEPEAAAEPSDAQDHSTDAGSSEGDEPLTKSSSKRSAAELN